MNDNLKNLYNTLVSCGYNPPAFDQFAKDMQDEKNLRGVYSTLQKEGYTPPSFDTFKSDMGYVAPAAQPQQTAAQPVVKQTTGQVNPTVNTSVQPKQVGMQIDETIQNVNQRQQNMMEYSKQRLQHPFGQPQVQIGLNRKNTPTVFDNRNLVQGRDGFNPETGKLEPTYLTASGNKYNSKVMADAEQRQIGCLGTKYEGKPSPSSIRK